MTDCIYDPIRVEKNDWPDYQARGWVRVPDIVKKLGATKQTVGPTIRRNAQFFRSAIKVFGVGLPFTAISTSDLERYRAKLKNEAAKKRRRAKKLAAIAAEKAAKRKKYKPTAEDKCAAMAAADAVLSTLGVCYAG